MSGHACPQHHWLSGGRWDDDGNQTSPMKTDDGCPPDSPCPDHKVLTARAGEPATACEHRVIVTYTFDNPENEGDVALWACQDCRRKFAPKAIEAADARTTALTVERLAKALYERNGVHDRNYKLGRWESLLRSSKDWYRNEARAILAALDAGAERPA